MIFFSLSQLSLSTGSFFLYNTQRPRYGHLAVSVARNVPFAGAFTVVERQSELKISEANAGAKPPECESGSQ